MDYNRPININITTLAVIKIFLVFIMFYFLYLVREVLAILFISLILSSALDPWVDWMQGKKIPRAMGVLFIYLAMFLVVATVIYLIIPPIVTQVSELTENFPTILEKVISGFEVLRSYSVEHGLLDNVK